MRPGRAVVVPGILEIAGKVCVNFLDSDHPENLLQPAYSVPDTLLRGWFVPVVGELQCANGLSRLHWHSS